MRFIHSADWQFGTSSGFLRARAAEWRAARLRTLRRALALASERGARAFIVAGDLFEDNDVGGEIVHAVAAVFAQHDAVPVFLLPGNHDPLDGPGSIWARPPFNEPPAHVTVFREPAAIQLDDAWLLANPLTQKKSMLDPSLKLAELAARVPSGSPKIGITHGSPAIETRHSPDDFPIELDAATRAGLDYLALGHWHSFQTFDHGRMVMPGTPEQTRFEECGAGHVLEVNLSAAGAPPQINPVRVGELTWREIGLDITEPPAGRAFLEKAGAGCAEAARQIISVTLRGDASRADAHQWRSEVERALADYAGARVLDETTESLTPGEVETWQREHPLLREVLTDLRQLAAGALPDSDLSALSAHLGVPAATLTPAVAALAERLLIRELREGARR